MGSKYASLRSKIPEAQPEPSERETAIANVMATHIDRSFLNLTAIFNRTRAEADNLSDLLAEAKIRLEAVERIIREQLDAEGADSIKMNGFTWGPKVEPYPVAEDPSAIVKYFKENGMEDQLALKAGELASRLKTFIKEEALANELVIGVRTVIDQTTGEETEVPDVRSRIPGVRVFLKSSLSRVKS